MSSTGVDTSGLSDSESVRDSQLRRNLAYLETGDTGPSEFCWGDGLEPVGLQGKPPCEGGRYRGTTPPCSPQIGVGR